MYMKTETYEINQKNVSTTFEKNKFETHLLTG